MSRGACYWLMKVEPAAYTIDQLERDRTTTWEGVRNYKARNYLRDEIKVGDGVLFYASNADPSGVVGIAQVVRDGYPDPYQFKRGHKYHDPKSTESDPRWYAVDIRLVEKFMRVVSLAELKATRALKNMMVTQRGARLSIQPVTKSEFDTVRQMGHPRTTE